MTARRCTALAIALATSLVSAAACSGKSDPAPLDDDSTLNGAGGNGNGAGGSVGNGGSGGVQTLPPLMIGLVVHLEGWPLDDEAIFNGYADGIRGYAKLANDYDAVFSWETRNVIGASQQFGDNILLDLRDNYGQGVGVHADIGGNPNGTLGPYQTILNETYAEMVELGISPQSLSGVCSHLPWVEASASAGYRSISGVVRYCLKSLPESEQPQDVKDCTSPAQCHQTYPSTAGARIHPWRASESASFTTHAADGDLVIVPSFGSVVCLKENEDSSDSNTGCTFDGDDISVAFSMIDEALTLRDAGKVNQLHFVWSYGQAIDKQLLAELLAGIDQYVQAGDAGWHSMDDMVDAYLALPVDKQMP